MNKAARISFKTKVIRIGNSLGIIIPQPLCKSGNLKVGDKVDLSLGKNGSIIMVKIKNQ